MKYTVTECWQGQVLKEPIEYSSRAKALLVARGIYQSSNLQDQGRYYILVEPLFKYSGYLQDMVILNKGEELVGNEADALVIFINHFISTQSAPV